MAQDQREDTSCFRGWSEETQNVRSNFTSRCSSAIVAPGPPLSILKQRASCYNIASSRAWFDSHFAIELSPQMAASLEKRGANVVCAMVLPLPEMDRQFDFAVMINVMEHMNSMQDALQITQQIRQILKPKGKFVICSPDYLNYRHNFFNCDFSHSYVTTRRRLNQLLISGGFNNIKSCYLSGPMTGIKGMLISAIASHMPFGFLNGVFPNSKVFHKLYKIQLTFSRKVLILGEKSG